MTSIINCATEDVGRVGMDQALLTIRIPKPGNGDQYSLWLQSTECHQCPLIETCQWNDTTQLGGQLLLDTRYPVRLAVRKGVIGGTTICELEEHFGEHGSYNLTIFDGDCRVDSVIEPVNSYLPILYVFIAYVILLVVYFSAKFGQTYWRKRRASAAADDATSETPYLPLEPPALTPRQDRLRSLDAFRGLAIATMIFVNLGGGGYHFFAHSMWNGLTVADVVFPWFLFIMGTSMYLSLGGSARRRVPLWTLWCRIARRSAVLFALGLFLNGGVNNDLMTIRIFGVLQRIGAVYLLVGFLLCSHYGRQRREETENVVPIRLWPKFSDVTTLWLEWLLVILMVTAHTCITFFLPVPGCPRGYLGPGGLADNAQYGNCTGGAGGYVDRLLLSPDHMHSRPTCKRTYHTETPYDPEGVFGTMMATLTVFLGVQAGATLSAFSSHRCRLARWIMWGVVCGAIGLCLCECSKNDGWIPVNKNLWSLSYVFVTAGVSFVPLALLYYVIDVKRWWNGAPLYQPGMNPIVLFMSHECFGRYLPFSWQPLVDPDTHASRLAMNAWATSLFVLLAICLHHKKIYISV